MGKTGSQKAISKALNVYEVIHSVIIAEDIIHAYNEWIFLYICIRVTGKNLYMLIQIFGFVFIQGLTM